MNELEELEELFQKLTKRALAELTEEATRIEKRNGVPRSDAMGRAFHKNADVYKSYREEGKTLHTVREAARVRNGAAFLKRYAQAVRKRGSTPEPDVLTQLVREDPTGYADYGWAIGKGLL